MRPVMQVRAERAPFVMLPRWLLYHPEVGEGAKFLYCVLHDLVNGREGPTRPVTRAKLAELCRVSANTIDRRLVELLAAGAVDKEPQILAGGQVANVYQVWLTPPEQRKHRIPTDGEPPSGRIPTDGDPVPTDPVPVDERIPTDGEARSERIPLHGEPPHQRGTPLLTVGEPTVLKEEVQEPPCPRTAGESRHQGVETTHCDVLVDQTELLAEQPVTGAGEVGPRPIGRRWDGTNLRAVGANPRAREAAAAAERDRERTALLEAALDAKAAARLAAEEAGEAERVAFEAEALAVSAALDDDQLAAVVGAVRNSLVGPLADSKLAVTRAVVNWCRAAVADCPGAPSLTATVAAALAAARDVPAAGVGLSPLTLEAAPAGTVPLRRRIAALLDPVGVG